MATIDAAGRVVIPKLVREVLGLAPGTQLEVEVRDGLVVLVPRAADVRLVERSGRLVAVPEGEVPPLTTDLVRDALERSRR